MKHQYSGNLNSQDVFFVKHTTSAAAWPAKEDKCAFNKDLTSKTIFVVFNLSSWLGITFTKASERSRFCCLSVWDSLSLLSVIFTYAISVQSVKYFNVPVRITYTFYSYISLGLLIRIAMLCKVNCMFAVATDICQLCNKLNVEAKEHWKLIRIQVGVISICLVMITAVCSAYFMTVELDLELSYFLFGFKLDVLEMPAVVYIIRFSLAYSAITSTAMIFVAVILCTNTYMTARNILKAFSNYFKKDTLTQSLSKYIILSYMRIYRNMITSFKDIDEVLSGSCLLLYAASFTSFFNTVSIAFSDLLKEDMTFLIQVLISLLLAIFIFFTLTLAGSNVNSEYEKLRLLLLKHTEGIFKLTNDHQLTSVYRTLVDNVNSFPIYFTGADMFLINKALILTTGGALITYGVIIFQ